jgi:hypothetical protein
MIVDSFGSLGAQKSSLAYAYEALAKNLVSQGFKVSVIYSGTEVPALSSIASQYRNQGIEFSR